MACVVPCVRFNDVVWSLMSEVCVPVLQARDSGCHPRYLAEVFSTRRSLLKPTLAASFITATLGTSGWLGLVRQGLSPCKKRQASLGAPTVSVTRWWAGEPTNETEKSSRLESAFFAARTVKSAARFVSWHFL